MEEETVQFSFNKVKLFVNKKKPKWMSFYLIKLLVLIGIIIGSVYLYTKIAEKKPVKVEKSPSKSRNYEPPESNSLLWSLPTSLPEMEERYKYEQRTINPTATELEAKLMLLTYSSVSDMYYRPNNKDKKIEGYNSFLYYSENVYRKHERDWEQVYLCRREGTHKKAYLVWKVSFQETKATRVYISIGNFTLYGNGTASASVCGSDGLCTNLNNEIELNEAELHGVNYLTVSVILSGGSEYRSWQHSQLFRTSTQKYFLDSLAKPRDNLRIQVHFQ